MKWPSAAPNSRRGIAEALATVTPAFLSNGTGGRQPTSEAIRDALYGWAFNAARRASGGPPEALAQVVTWIGRSTLSLAEIDDPVVTRRALDTLARKLDGAPAAATTIARKRAVLYNAFEYAIERGDLDANPLDHIRWTAPKALETVDFRVVINHDQARALLAAVEAQGDAGRRLKAFFGCMYYAALRPAEVTNLTEDALDLPTSTGWGELHPAESIPAVASDWTDTGRRESRQLKHRARGETRNVPCAPPLTRLINDHIAKFGIGRDGRIFRGTRGGPVPDTVYCAVWREARRRALTPSEVASPLAARPYDLRHAAVSTWLNAGIPPTQVAEWAGHSVNVLLRVYAKCIVGQHLAAIRRLSEVLDPNGEPSS
jgi:integrase